jgi:hypothetical protein
MGLAGEFMEMYLYRPAAGVKALAQAHSGTALAANAGRAAAPGPVPAKRIFAVPRRAMCFKSKIFMMIFR